MSSSIAKVPGDGPESVHLYFEDISGRPVLDRCQEASLGQAVQEGLRAQRRLADVSDLDPVERARLRLLVEKGQQARHRFVEANLRLVVYVAKRYRCHDLDFLDLIQEGNLGLIHAVEKFDWERGFKFSTYAIWWIRRAISGALADKGRLIRLPRHAHTQEYGLVQARDRLRIQLRREPTLAEAAAEAGIDAARVVKIVRANHHRSLSSDLGSGDVPLVEVLGDDGATDPLEEVVRRERIDQIRALLDRLDDREAEVLKLHFGLGGNQAHTLEQVSRSLGISRERARQLETRALLRLRHDRTARTLTKMFAS